MIKKLKKEELQKLLVKLRLGVKEYKRVIKKTKKPNKEEFIEVVKITGLGMIIIGVIGFLIQTIFLQIIKI